MGVFRVPYRWLPRTFWANIRSCWLDIFHGVRNIVRWVPVIWQDEDWDWADTAHMMEIKLRRLADCMENGHHANGKRHAREARICAALLKRLMEDKYVTNAGYDPETWESLPHHRQRWIAEHTRNMLRQDQRYLGLLIGKYFTNWWD